MSSAFADIKCSGYVQGVGYRYFSFQKAKLYSLQGWVRNCPDGTVHIAVEGEKSAIESYINILKEGPSAAEVTDVIVNWKEPTNSFSNFQIKY